MDVPEFFKSGLEFHKYALSKDFKQKTLKDRLDNFKNNRKQTRNNTICNNRKIDKNMTPYKTPEPKMGKVNQKNSSNKVNTSLFQNSHPKGSRFEMLQKWKLEKEKRIVQERSKMKPIFKVCHVQDKIGLPDLDKVNNEIKGKPIKKNPTPLKSRFAPANHEFRPPTNIKPIYIDKNRPPSTRLTRQTVIKKEEATKRKLDFNKDFVTNALPVKHNTRNKVASMVNLRKSVSENNLAKTKVTPKKGKGVQHTKKAEMPKSNTKVTTPPKKARGRPKKNPVEIKVEKAPEIKTTNTIKTPKSAIKTQQKLPKIETTRTPKSAIKTQQKIEKTPKTETANTIKTPKSGSKTTKNFEKTPKNSTRTQKNIKKAPCGNNWDVEYNGESSEEKSSIPSTSTIDSNNLEKFTTPEKQENDAFPVYVSPFVTVSRGKNSARKEYQIRNSMSKSLSESPTFENKDVSKHTSPKAGAEYFSRKLEREINRIERVCNEWESYKEESDIPSEALDMIDVAIGQSRLLIAKKFQQFRGLVEQCRTCEYAEKPITCKDLHGFWDMIYMQVEDLDKRFSNLRMLRGNNWEELMPEIKAAVIPVAKRGRPASKKTKASSGLRELIKAQRSKKRDVESGGSDEGKTFDGGYFCVKSPVRGCPGSAKRMSLRMSVLASEAKKRGSSPGLAMMRLSQAIKCGDGLTPGKSILKPEGAKSAKKSVLFKEDLPRISVSKAVLFRDDSSDDSNDENDANRSNLSGPSATRKSSRLNKV
ncbi:unnamed protein product [Brassicogethes aeneus]|uniref:Disks large-associated protein 5 n=1 Tax=Brassicogethes aeneus TaxID=1431903 RepID=A0A9P0FB41_BRAAE|nr:unnamed protein product [Brassicogethes aeneus]